MNLLDLMIKVAVDDQASDGIAGIAKKASTMADGLSKLLPKVAKVGTVAAGAASTALGFLTKNSASNFAEYEQLVGGAKLMFGDAYDFIAEKAAGAYATVQMSQNEYLQQVNGFATGLKTALGGNEQAAAELADRILRAEADIVAATGAAQESVQNAFNGIMKSNFTMLDNLQIGITPTKEGFQELIDKVNQWNEANGKATAYQMGNLADMQNALVDYIDMVGMSNYAQNEALATISGSMAAAKSAWQNFLTGLVDENADLSALTENLVGSVSVAADNLLPRLQQFVSGVMNAFGELTGIDLSGFVSSVSSGIGQAVTLVDELGDAFADSGVAGAVDVLVSRFEALTGIDLSGAASSVLSLASAFGEFAVGKIESTASAISTIFAPFRENATPIIESVSGAVESFLASLTEFDTSSGLQPIASGVAKLLAPFADALPDIIESVSGALESFFGFVDEAAAGPIASLADTVVKLLSPFVEGAADLIIGVSDALGGIFSYAEKELGEPLQDVADAMGDLLTPFTEDKKQVTDDIITVLTNFVTYIGKEAVDKVAEFADELSRFLGFLEPIATNFYNSIDALVEFVKALFDAEGDAEEIGEAIGEYFRTSAENVLEWWEDVEEFFGGLKGKIVGFFDGIGDDFWSIGSDIVDGIKNGISATWNTLENLVTGFWNGLIGKSEEVNEVNSPSRVYYRIARQLVDGAVVGWRENFGRLQDLVETDFAALAPAGSAMVPTARVDFAESAIGKSSAASINSTFAALTPLTGSGQSGDKNINLVVDGRVLASVVYNPLSGLIRQKGESMA